MASVDVLVPCYQYGRYLRGCVESILSQGIQDLRVRIIDNASTDDSVGIARRLMAEDSRVDLVAHPRNLGPHASFNEGIDWAGADYFLILCVDDLLAPGALARAVAVMEQNPDVVLTYGQTQSITLNDFAPAVAASGDPSWRIMPGRELIERFCRTGRNHVPGPTVLVRTSAQKQAGHYRPELSHTDDLELWMRIACLGRVAETTALQAFARTHTGNQSSTVADIHLWNVEFEAAFVSFFGKEGASLPDAAKLRRTALRTLAERAYWGGMSRFAHGDGGLGLKQMKFAFSRSPISMILPPLGHLLQRPDLRSRISRMASQAGRRLRFPIIEGQGSH